MPGWLVVVRVLASFLALGLLALAAFAAIAGNRMIFLPRTEGDWALPRRSGGRVEEVTLRASDGVALVSWFRRVETARATVLLFHGNAGNLTDRVDFLDALADLGCDAFVLGYRGYGRSEGRPSEDGFSLDADAAHDFLVRERGVSPGRLVLVGESLGGGVAIDLATRRPCAGLVLQSPFASIREMSRRVLPLFPAHWFVRTKFDNLGRIGRVGVPLLVLATRDDEVVPYGQSRRVFEAATAPKEWVEFDGCGHNDLLHVHRDGWMRAVGAFLDQIAARREGASAAHDRR